MKPTTKPVEPVEALRQASEKFHEIVSAFSSADLLASARNAVIADKLRDNLRSIDQLRRIAADGFELCVRALADLGAPDVTIHECGDRELEDRRWEDRR